jgi:membrane-associated progesterone receptor component
MKTSLSPPTRHPLLHKSKQQENLWLTALAVFLGTTAILALQSALAPRPPPLSLEDEAGKCGDITPAALAKHTGADPFKPIYLAIRGVVYDVSKGRSFYGPGGGYAALAGTEAARALAKMSLKPEDLNSADLADCSPSQLATLEEWEAKLKAKYPVAGRVVAPLELTLEELKAHDGSDAAKPIFLAIRGVVYDVSSGRQFYGPDGVYPFAGRECARAFALVSTDTADCTADLSGLGPMEMESLRDWTAKFDFKYPVVGRVVEGKKAQ